MKNRNFKSLEETILKCGGEWGFNHSKRLLAIIHIIAQGIKYDRDVMEFCVFTHDLGAYAPYAKEKTDHAVRSREIIDEFTGPYDFSPEEKLIIYETILNHHNPVTLKSMEAVLLRDADAIDFLGFMGAARDLSRAPRDMKKGLASIQAHRAKLPALLTLDSSKKLGEERIRETDTFLNSFTAESFGFF